MWDKLMKQAELGEPTPLLDQVYFGCKQRERKPNLKIVHDKKLFESLISAGTVKQLFGWERSHGDIIVRSYDLEGHAKKCVERYRELANKNIEQSYRVSTPCMDDHQSKDERIRNSWGIVKHLSTNRLEMLMLSWHRQA